MRKSRLKIAKIGQSFVKLYKTKKLTHVIKKLSMQKNIECNLTFALIFEEESLL